MRISAFPPSTSIEPRVAAVYTMRGVAPANDPWQDLSKLWN